MAYRQCTPAPRGICHNLLHHVGLPNCFAAATVGADRIRPQHKAPLRGACAGSTISRPYKAYAFIRVLAKNRGYGTEPSDEWYNVGCCPTQPGAIEKPGLRAAISRPYRAYALIRVLAKTRGYGRILSAPTGRMRSSGYLRKSGCGRILSAPTTAAASLPLQKHVRLFGH